jgi:hypothetical protein
MNSVSSAATRVVIVCSKIADIVVLALLVIFFVGFLAFDYELLRLHNPFVRIPHESEQYFEVMP